MRVLLHGSYGSVLWPHTALSIYLSWFGAVASHSTIFAFCYFRVVVSGRHMQISFCSLHISYFIFKFQFSDSCPSFYFPTLHLVLQDLRMAVGIISCPSRCVYYGF